MKEHFFIKNGFKKKWNSDMSAFWWQKKINHPLFKGFKIIVEDDCVIINANEIYENNAVTLMMSDDTSTANISDIMDVIFLGKNGFNDRFFNNSEYTSE